MSFNRFVLSFGSLVALASIGIESHGQPSGVERATADLCRAWERAADALPSCRLSETMTFAKGEDGECVVSSITHDVILYSHSGALIGGRYDTIEKGMATPGESRRFLWNSDYTATIASKDASVWRVESVTLNQQLPQPDTVPIRRPDHQVEGRLPWLKHDGLVSFYRVLKDPRTKITKVEPIQNRRRFSFTFDTSIRPQPTELLDATHLHSHTVLRSGWFEVSGADCRIDAYDLELSTPPKYVPHHSIGTIEYFNRPSDPVPLVKNAVIETPKYVNRLGKELRLRTVKEYQVEFPINTQREFYLSHYGLPEPPGIIAPSRPTPTYVWLLIAAGGFGVLALGCRWVLKRRSKATLPPSVPPTA